VQAPIGYGCVFWTEIIDKGLVAETAKLLKTANNFGTTGSQIFRSNRSKLVRFSL